MTHSAKSQLKAQRSSRACVSCRCRKVRCDVTSKGAPCTRCQFHNIQCSVPLDRRREKASSAKSLLEKSVPSSGNPLRMTDRVAAFGGEHLRLKAGAFDNPAQPSLWEHVDRIEPTQAGKMIFSHFMMNPWERNLLAELAPPPPLPLEEEECIHADGLDWDSMFEQFPGLKSPQSSPSEKDTFSGHSDAQSVQDGGQLGGNCDLLPTPESDQSIDLDFVQAWDQMGEIEWDFFSLLSQNFE